MKGRSAFVCKISLDKLRARFSADVSERIIGVTPVFPSDHPRMVEQRESEILAWLMAQGRIAEPWLALDDAAWQFKHHRDHLVACTGYLGLDASTELKLRAALIRA